MRSMAWRRVSLMNSEILHFVQNDIVGYCDSPIETHGIVYWIMGIVAPGGLMIT
jgi:hypothetical protein